MIKEFFARFDAAIKILLIAGMLLIAGFLFLGQKKPEVFVREQPFELIDKCGEECEKKIAEIVTQTVATLSAKPVQKTQVFTQTTPTAIRSQIEYIPVGGAGSTTQRDWTDLLNTDFFLDIGEYGRTREIRWTTTLKVFQGNGEAFARLFDVTHGVAVQGSEIKTTNEKFTLVESGLLTFHFSGKNRYRVQVKSLTGYEAFFDSGRIKIVTE